MDNQSDTKTKNLRRHSKDNSNRKELTKFSATNYNEQIFTTQCLARHFAAC